MKAIKIIGVEVTAITLAAGFTDGTIVKGNYGYSIAFKR